MQALQTQMAVRHFRGEAMEKTLNWAANELKASRATKQSKWVHPFLLERDGMQGHCQKLDPTMPKNEVCALK